MPSDWWVEVDGIEENQHRLDLLSTMLLDLRPFWPRLTTLFVSWMGRQFETEGAFLTDPWAPLTPDYAARKALKHPGKGILVAEGDLKRGATTPRREQSPSSITFILGWVKRGQSLDPKWHHRGEGHNRRRPLIGTALPDEAQLEFDQALEDYAEDMLQRLGFRG